MKLAHSSVVLVFNDSGELALQLRSASDDKYPSHWDFSAAGGIEPGESPNKAALRELQEEIGITSDLEFVTELMYEDVNGQDQIYLYRTVHNGPFKADGFEVEKVDFFTLAEIDQMIQAGEKFHPEFPYLWKLGLIK